MMKKITNKLILAAAILFSLFLTAHSAVVSKPQTSPSIIGIISAIKMETDYLKSQLKDMKTWKMMGRSYYTGRLNGRKVVVSQVGIGIVNAAVGTATLIDEFSPSAVIMTGVAGGTSKTQPGEIVIASKVTFYDFGMLDTSGKFHRSSSYTPDSDFSGSNVKKTPLFFSADKNLLKHAVAAARDSNFSNLKYGETVYLANAVQGIIATSEIFNEYAPQINIIMKSTGCIAFDMECAGPAQVCYNQKVPFITIKSISDNGDFAMFNALKYISAKNAQILVENMIKNL